MSITVPVYDDNIYLEKIAVNLDWLKKPITKAGLGAAGTAVAGAVGSTLNLHALREWLVHHGSVGGVVHLAQNGLTAGMLRGSDKYKKAFSDYFHAGFEGRGYPSSEYTPVRRSAFTSESEHMPAELGQEATHLSGSHHDIRSEFVRPRGGIKAFATGALNPEMGIILEEAHAAGKHAREHLLAQHNKVVGAIEDPAAKYLGKPTQPRQQAPLTTDTLSQDVRAMMGRKGMVLYSRALRGDFTHLHDLVKKYPHLRQQAHDSLVQMQSQTHYPITEVLHDRGMAQRVEAAYKENPISGRLIAGLADKPSGAGRGMDTMAERSPSSMHGAMATAVVDPVAGGLNAAKLALSDKKLLDENPRFKHVADKLSETFLLGPIRHAAKTGYEDSHRQGPLFRAVNKYVVNHAAGQVEDAANSIAYQAGRWQAPIRRNLSVPEDIQ